VSGGHEVIVFDHFRRDSSNLNKIIEKITIVKGEFDDPDVLTEAMSGTDYLFHYISTTTPVTATANPVYDLTSNVIPTLTLLKLAVESGVRKVIFPSSGGTIYGEGKTTPIPESSLLNPLNPYAISKMTIEKYLQYFYRRYGLDFLIIRYSNPYGERQNPQGTQGVIPIFLDKIKRGESPVIFGDGSSSRDYIYIDDAIDATLQLLESSRPAETFNVGSGTGTSLNELVAIMEKVTGETISPSYIPDDRDYIKKIVLDISKIRRSIHWSPKIRLPEGIGRTWEYIRHRGS